MAFTTSVGAAAQRAHNRPPPSTRRRLESARQKAQLEPEPAHPVDPRAGDWMGGDGANRGRELLGDALAALIAAEPE